MPNDEIAALLAALADTPHRIRAIAAGRTAAELTAAPAGDGLGDEDSWSALAVLAHVRSSADFITSRLIMMLVRDEPTLPAVDERRWCSVMGYLDVEFHTLLDGLAVQRADLVRALRRLEPRDWQRAGHHETRGRVTVLETARLLADHETEHCLQMEAALT